jgi:hypothetical protein
VGTPSEYGRSASSSHDRTLSFGSVFLHRASRGVRADAKRSGSCPCDPWHCENHHLPRDACQLSTERIHASSWISASSSLMGQTPTMLNLPPLLSPALSDNIKRAMYSTALERSHLFCSCVLDTYGYPYK